MADLPDYICNERNGNWHRTRPRSPFQHTWHSSCIPFYVLSTLLSFASCFTASVFEILRSIRLFWIYLFIWSKWFPQHWLLPRTAKLKSVYLNQPSLGRHCCANSWLKRLGRLRQYSACFNEITSPRSGKCFIGVAALDIIDILMHMPLTAASDTAVWLHRTNANKSWYFCFEVSTRWMRYLLAPLSHKTQCVLQCPVKESHG